MGTSEFADLTGLRAMVTGASRGIGRAMILEFARAGADTIVHCNRSIDAANTVSRQIEQLGVKSVVLRADLEEPSTLGDFVEAAWAQWDGIDIWVNNAGVDLLTGDGATLAYDVKFQKLLDIDVRCSILLSKLIGQRMRAAGQGVILNIGWDQADRGMQGDSGELFSAAKNAIMGFTRSLAVSLAPEVRVNCIAPGWIRTAWGQQAGEDWQRRVRKETPLGRWGEPQDIAALARFLASSDAQYITGQVIAANGGAVR